MLDWHVRVSTTKQDETRQVLMRSVTSLRLEASSCMVLPADSRPHLNEQRSWTAKQPGILNAVHIVHAAEVQTTKLVTEVRMSKKGDHSSVMISDLQV